MNKSANPRRKKRFNIIIWCTLIVILIVVITTFICINFTTKKVTCINNKATNNIKENNEITFYLKKDEITSISVQKLIVFSNINNKFDYLSTLKNILDDAYSKLGIKYNVKVGKDNLKIALNYKNKQKYILNNTEFNVTDDGLSVNIISEDRENNYASVDLSKKYNKSHIIKQFNKYGYSCE